MERRGVYFVSDVHLGLKVPDAAERERRFVDWLDSIPANAEALWLLGDIWDFWYEYHDVVPKEGIRVIAALIRLMDKGVQVNFIPGNHDIWTYHFFEEIGIRKCSQPCFVTIDGVRFCLGHGDGIGGAKLSYKILNGIFHCRFLQALFSSLHPRIAFAFGNCWSGKNRQAHTEEYQFVAEKEPIGKWAMENSEKAEYFIFGHFHRAVDYRFEEGKKRLVILDSWLQASPYLYFDGKTLSSVSHRSSADRI